MTKILCYVFYCGFNANLSLWYSLLNTIYQPDFTVSIGPKVKNKCCCVLSVLKLLARKPFTISLMTKRYLGLLAKKTEVFKVADVRGTITCLSRFRQSAQASPMPAMFISMSEISVILIMTWNEVWPKSLISNHVMRRYKFHWFQVAILHCLGLRGHRRLPLTHFLSGQRRPLQAQGKAVS